MVARFRTVVIAYFILKGRCVMPSNGETSRTFGVYKTVCCEAEIVIGVGVPFPDCPNHKKLPTEWKQIPDVDPEKYYPNVAGKINLSDLPKRKSARL